MGNGSTDEAQSSAGTGTKNAEVSAGGTAGALRGAGGKSSVSGNTAADSGTGGASGGNSQSGISQPGASGTSGGTGGTVSEPERCSQDGAMRCSMQGQGKREMCTGGFWASGTACASGETCTSLMGTPACKKVAELCKGSNGQAVCDAQGNMFLCNPDDTVSSQVMCKSARLCQDGISSRGCALCMAKDEHQCTGASLEVCADDGKSFTKVMDCTSAALCNKDVGMCTSAVCMPEMSKCEDNVLKKCKADRSGYDDATAVPCGMGTCDAKGGDCNMCEPGQKTCMGDSVLTCDPTGQMLTPAPCGSGMKCTGAGQCVQCTVDGDCSALTKDCKVGACEQYKCIAKDASAGKACTASNGKPGKCQTGGTCECTPQCNKACGDNGCGAQCPNTCGSLMCVKDACVECTADSQCKSTDCEAGVCGSNGRCTRSAAQREGDPCKAGSLPGTCAGGSCVCKSDCGTQHCSTDSCGHSCNFTCGPGMECTGNKCAMTPVSAGFTACSSTSDCSGGDFCSSFGYCTKNCDSMARCSGSRICIDMFTCAIPKPCPPGLNETTITGTAGTQTFCVAANTP